MTSNMSRETCSIDSKWVWKARSSVYFQIDMRFPIHGMCRWGLRYCVPQIAWRIQVSSQSASHNHSKSLVHFDDNGL